MMELAGGADLDRVGLNRLLSTQKALELGGRPGAGPPGGKLGPEHIGDLDRDGVVAHRTPVLSGTSDVARRSKEFRVSVADVLGRQTARSNRRCLGIAHKPVLD